MPSQVSLCNKALRRLGEDPITALDENSTWGRRCIPALPEVVRTILSLDAWRSCTKRAEIAADQEAPIGYNSAYQLPNDCLRLLALKQSQYQDWSIEGNKILTNKSPDESLQILYVAEVTDPNKYTPTLYEAIALGLAHELSGYSTATNVSKDDIYQLYLMAVSVAQEANNKENPVHYLSTTSWIDARTSSLDRGLYGAFYEGE
ncbi:head completion adaptor [Vibrio phage 1.182.O._10N.286.46.E1]|nr:head completion adaptor [Vibrio phage 1.182.O._10N.286.46.E1]